MGGAGLILAMADSSAGAASGPAMKPAITPGGAGRRGPPRGGGGRLYHPAGGDRGPPPPRARAGFAAPAAAHGQRQPGFARQRDDAGHIGVIPPPHNGGGPFLKPAIEESARLVI